jgi:hypothetical protein
MWLHRLNNFQPIINIKQHFLGGFIMKRSILSIMILAAFLLFSCSKDSSTSPEKTTPDAPQAIEASAPAKAPAEVDTVIEEYNGYFVNWLQWIECFNDVDAVVSGDTLIWTYETQNGFKITLKSFKNEDGSTSWQLWFEGGAQNYTKWLVMEGTVSADKKSGYWEIYGYGLEYVLMTSSWVIDEQGNITINYNILGIQYDIVNNADGSGSLIKWYNKDENKKAFEAVWLADGSGWWKMYNYDGSVLHEGDWDSN